jgi:hypothetical protein
MEAKDAVGKRKTSLQSGWRLSVAKAHGTEQILITAPHGSNIQSVYAAFERLDFDLVGNF